MIHIQGLTKIYKLRPALAGVDLHIAAGEVFGLVGTNGAGRTTLLNIVATLLKASAGQVRVAGFDVWRQPMAVRRCLGYVPQSPGFYEALQVRAYLDFMASLRRMPALRKSEAIETALAHCLLDPAGLIKNLSRGCRQQLALAAAVLPEPAVLLLDEPAAHLDPLARQRLQGLLQNLRTTGTTIILACNTLVDFQGLCDRIGFLHQGRLLDIRPVTEASLDPAAVLLELLAHDAADDPGFPSALGDGT